MAMELALVYVLGLPLFFLSCAGLCSVFSYARKRKFKEHREKLLNELKRECEVAFCGAESPEAHDHPAVNDDDGPLASIEEQEVPKLDAYSDIESEKAYGAAQSFDELPSCVQRYLTHAIRDTRRLKMFALLQQIELRFSPTTTWKPLAAMQYVCPLKPAYFFSGSMRMAPMVSVVGYESLLGGKGRTNWRIWGSVSVADAAGELADKAAHTRWLAEAMCYPQALQPSHFLRWEAVEGKGNEAKAVLQMYNGGSVSAIFTFNSQNNVVKFRSDDYARALPKVGVVPCGMVGRGKGHMLFGLTPQAQWSIVQTSTSGGIVIPTEFEGSFVEENGDETPYIKVIVAKVTTE